MADRGKRVVMAEAVKAASAALADAPVQEDMFALPTHLQGEAAAALQEVAQKARGGRPVGAVNRSTAEFRRWLLLRGVSPLESMMRWSLHSPDTLALELGISKAEAFDRLAMLWRDLAPYMHSKVAPTDDDGKAVPILNVQIGGSGGLAGLPSGLPWEYDGVVLDNEQNQSLKDGEPAASHAKKSHGPESSDKSKA